MNAGMRDLINLAWKLPLVLNQICAETLLDTYPLERAGHAHDLVSWAVSMGHLMTHLAAIEAAERAGKPNDPSNKPNAAFVAVGLGEQRHKVAQNLPGQRSHRLPGRHHVGQFLLCEWESVGYSHQSFKEIDVV